VSAIQRIEPLTASEWADKYFYLSKESSYISGRWVTLPFQIAILNSMGCDNIQQVDVEKSARIGYTKMLLANMAYKAEHKKRKQGIWFPTDGDAKEFSKVEFDNMVRDVPCVQKVFPQWDSKSPKNTIDLKPLIGSTIYIKGGRSGKNYRRISVDEGLIDELDAFDRNIGGTEKSGGESSDARH
jgi:phage terminase large subunit GpA-like protein